MAATSKPKGTLLIRTSLVPVLPPSLELGSRTSYTVIKLLTSSSWEALRSQKLGGNCVGKTP